MEKGNWCVLLIVTLISMMNQAGRFMLSFVAAGSDFLDDTNTSEVEYGALAGSIFLFPYGIFQILTGKLVDNISSPKWLLLAGSLIWNVANALTGIATNFAGLIWPRVIFAVSSSVLDTTAFMMIAAFFPQN